MEAMGLTVMGERGQIVIPKDIRDRLGLTPGAQLVAVAAEGSRLLLVPVEQMRDWIAQMNQNFANLSSGPSSDPS